MGKRGPKPKPPALKLIEGERRPSRLNPARPRPDRGIPPPPAWLGPEGLREWERLAPELDRLGVMTHLDGLALGLLCATLEDWVRYRAKAREGVTRPYANLAAAALGRLLAMLSAFGMTPADRARVNASSPEEDDHLGAFLSDRGPK